MFGWLRRMYDSAAGFVDNTVRSWVHELVNGLYGYLHLIFGPVINAWDKLVHAGWLVWVTADNFIDEVVLALHLIWNVVLPQLRTETQNAINRVLAFAKSVYAFAVRELNALRQFILHLIAQVTTWVTTHVYDPLKTLFDMAWHWITHEGAVVWHYISNPQDLVELIWDWLIVKLEREAWTIGRKLGQFTLSLIVHNLTRIVTLIEDILDAVF